MILSAKAVNVPSQSEIDADLAEYGHIGQACRVAYGLAAVEAGAPDYPDGEGADAAHTGAVDVVANVLHWAVEEGCEVDAILDGARRHVHAER